MPKGSRTYTNLDLSIFVRQCTAAQVCVVVTDGRIFRRICDLISREKRTDSHTQPSGSYVRHVYHMYVSVSRSLQLKIGCRKGKSGKSIRLLCEPIYRLFFLSLLQNDGKKKANSICLGLYLCQCGTRCVNAKLDLVHRTCAYSAVIQSFANLKIMQCSYSKQL